MAHRMDLLAVQDIAMARAEPNVTPDLVASALNAMGFLLALLKGKTGGGGKSAIELEAR
jgi:hypothetical protein